MLAWIILIVSLVVFVYACVPQIYGGFSRLLLNRKAVRLNAIVLTFDDGPGSSLTPTILNILDEYKAKATFFLLGRNIAGREVIVRQISEKGHEICSHSYDHLHGLRTSPFKVLSDIERGWNAIDSALGTLKKKYTFRPPNGKLNIISLLYLLIKQVPIVYWSMDSGDTWREMPDRQRLADVAAKEGGVVSLAHDFDRKNEKINQYVVESLRLLLSMAADKGMRVITVSELLDLDR